MAHHRTTLLAVAVLLGLLAPALTCSAQPASAATHHKPHGKHKQHAPVRAVRCKPGQTQLQVGKRTLCSKPKPLPTTKLSPQATAIANAFAFQLGAKTKDRRHRHPRSLTKLLTRLGPHTLQKTEQTIALDLRRGELLALAGAGAFGAKAAAARARAASTPVAFAAAGCKSGDQLEKMLKQYDDAPPDVKEQAKEDVDKLNADKSYKDGDMTSKVDFEQGAIKLGIDIKGKGIRMSLTIRACGVDGGNDFSLKSCPTADGKVEGEDHSEFEVAFKIFEGAKLVLAQGFKLSAEATVKAQTGDDGKLDYYDIKHIYSVVASFGGSKTAFGPASVDMAYIGEAHIDLSAGDGASAPPAVVDARISMAGADPAEVIKVEIEIAHKAQAEADKMFSAEVKKATSNLRSAEKHWMTPKACAKIVFNPGSNTLTLHKGQNGTFTSTTQASDGNVPAKAEWTVSDQQNATFTPGASEGNQLSTSYNVTHSGPKIYVEVTVKATSKAGVAEEKWIQKTNEPLNTLTGTFKGRSEHEGEIFEWTGTATLQKRDLGTSTEASRAFGLISGEATITASGVSIGTGCNQTGTQTLAIQPTATWAVEGEEAPFKYEIVFPFEFPGGITVNLIHCAHPEEEVSTFRSIGPAALQSGELTVGSSPSEVDFGPYIKTTSDLYTYENKAIAFQGIGESVEWSWSFKGSP